MNIAAQAGVTKVNTAGGYRYIPSVFQYSSGVAAEDGFELVRARFHRPVPLHEGFAAIEAHLRALGRPLQAFAQCELRSPRPYTEEGFLAFNRHYVKTLEAWDLCDGAETPVARTHVCPVYDAPGEPSMHAFTYAMPTARPARRSSCWLVAVTYGEEQVASWSVVSDVAIPRPKACGRKCCMSSARWSDA